MDRRKEDMRENPDKIFQCFLEVVAPSETNQDSWILQKFPDSFNNREVLKAVSQFAYPCAVESNTVQHFSFVLTNIDSKWTFGYCRYAPSSPTCFCILSYLPWHETFYKLLDRIAEVTRSNDAGDLVRFLEAVNASLVPIPGTSLRVLYDGGNSVFEVPCPDHRKLPSFPENRNLNEYYNAVDVNNMILIFASLLNERRVLITSSKLGRLSACVQAASALIYPMHWQHIFIPVLPITLLDYISAPMPFLIGIPTPVFEHAKRTEMGDVVILYADSNTVESPFDDLQSLPIEIVSGLKRKLKNTELLRGDGIARAFLYALVQLIGGYRDALTFRDGERISFCRDTFLQTRPNNMQPYLERMLHLQIFQQFIEERLDVLNSGKGFSDIFEEVSLENDKSSAKFKKQYKEWMVNMKKEGGALLRTVKSKANPAVKHAYKHMKDKSRKAYKEVRSMFQDPMLNKDVKCSAQQVNAQPRSAPSSPTTLVRSTAIHGTKFLPTWDWTRPSVTKSKDYSPLKSGSTPPDVALCEESSDSPEERSSSPDLSVQPINMDLMGDLQDLIFRRCSMEDNKSLTSVLPTSPTSVPTIVPKPNPDKSASPGDEIVKEVSLIRLDSEESDIVFDPLLASDNRPDVGLQQGHGSITGKSTSPCFAVSPTSPASPGLSNPVYFHVTPSPSPTFTNQVVPNGRLCMLRPATTSPTFFAANDIHQPYSNSAATTLSSRGSFQKNVAATAAAGLAKPSVTSNMFLNNNQPCTSQPFVLAPPALPPKTGGRLSTAEPQNSFLHSMAPVSRWSAVERNQMFDDLLPWDERQRSAVGAESCSSNNSNLVTNVDQRKRQWQTFE